MVFCFHHFVMILAFFMFVNVKCFLEKQVSCMDMVAFSYHLRLMTLAKNVNIMIKLNGAHSKCLFIYVFSLLCFSCLYVSLATRKLSRRIPSVCVCSFFFLFSHFYDYFYFWHVFFNLSCEKILWHEKVQHCAHWRPILNYEKIHDPSEDKFSKLVSEPLTHP